MSDDYAARALKFSLTSKEDIKEIAKDPTVKFLDVRSTGEVEAQALTSYPYVNAPCTMADTSKLTETAGDILPDKDGKNFSFILLLLLSVKY